MTKLEALRYGVDRYLHRHVDEVIPEILLERDGEWFVCSWSDFDSAKDCGCKYVGHIADEARKMGIEF